MHEMCIPCVCLYVNRNASMIVYEDLIRQITKYDVRVMNVNDLDSRQDLTHM